MEVAVCKHSGARLACNPRRLQPRSVVLLDGKFFENNTDLRWPSIACLDAAGNVLWSHFHHNRTRVAIGNDGGVATIGAAVELGDREWEGIGGLVGV
jgi:hypothetical protein